MLETQILSLTNYDVKERIGFGASSEVFKVSDRRTGEMVALKMFRSDDDTRQVLAKEVLIHQHMSHQNIIKFIDCFEESNQIYIVQELAEGGELFEQIEPDIGFPEQVAHFYFVQLINALNYIHSSGVCHRDLKPENLLLDCLGNLKVCDFGLSTVYLRSGKKRILKTRCGTPAFMSPEVVKGVEYDGEDADLWACAIILVVLLSGNLPWGHASNSCNDYQRFIKGKQNRILDSIPNGPKQIIKNILLQKQQSRWKIVDVQKSSWFLQSNSLLDDKFLSKNPELLMKLIRENYTIPLTEYDVHYLAKSSIFRLSLMPALTQPDQIRGRTSVNVDYFSQPQSAVIPFNRSQDNCKVFFRNGFARFVCKAPLETFMADLEIILRGMLVTLNKSITEGNCYHFNTVDKMKCPLQGTILFHKIDESVLVTIKKTRGNPIEYAKFFKFIVSQCSDFL